MNKLIKIAIVITLLMVMLPVEWKASAYPNSEAEFYEYIESIGYKQTVNGRKVSWIVYRDYNKIVYGSPFGRHKNDSMCNNNDEYEYLGYSKYSSPVNNTCFPNDATSGNHPKTWNFINVDDANTSWDRINDTSLINHIKNSKWTGNGATPSDPLKYSHVGSENKVKVQGLPTWRSEGAVYTRHKNSNGSIWYATFIVPPLADPSKALVDGEITTDKDTYTIEPDDDSVNAKIKVLAEAKLSGYMLASHISGLIARLDDKFNQETKQDTSVYNENRALTRKQYKVGTHKIKLNGTAKLATKFGDTDQKPLTKTITLIVKPPSKPTIKATGTNDPSTKKFNTGDTLSDVNIKVTVDGAITGIDKNNILSWTLTAYKDGESNKAQTKDITGASAKLLTQSSSFNFTVPKDKFKNGSYTQYFKVKVTAKLTNGSIIFDEDQTKTDIYPPSVEPPTEPVIPVDPPQDNNLPPYVNIIGPTKVKAGDMICLDSTSGDPDGVVVDQVWGKTIEANGNITGAKGCIWYGQEGNYFVDTQVFDDKGDSATDIHEIMVTPPTPTAIIDVKGTLKENRKVDLTDVSDAPDMYPITKKYWEIKALDSENESAIRFKGELDGSNVSDEINALFKKEGTYEVTLYVENKFASDTTKAILDIEKDLEPIANFSTSSIIYRDPNNQLKASIELVDESYSLDDSIDKRVWKYAFDSNNDGSYTDEIWNELDNENLTQINLDVNHVGKYLFELDVTEKFDQETIDEFVTSDDYLKGNTDSKLIDEKVVDVQNIAPIATFQPLKKNYVEMYFDMGDANNNPYNVTDVVSALNSKLKPTLAETNTELSFKVKQRPQLKYPEEIYLFTEGKYVATSDYSGYNMNYLYQYDPSVDRLRLVDKRPVATYAGAVDYDGNIYYTTQFYASNVSYYNPKTKTIGYIDIPGLDAIYSIVVGLNNKVYISAHESTNNTYPFYEYDPKTKNLRIVGTGQYTRLIAVENKIVVWNSSGNYRYYDIPTNTWNNNAFAFDQFETNNYIGTEQGIFIKTQFGYGANGSTYFLQGHNLKNGSTTWYTGPGNQMISGIKSTIGLGKNKILFSATPDYYNNYALDGTYEFDLSGTNLKKLFPGKADFIKAMDNDVYLNYGGLRKYNLDSNTFTNLTYQEYSKDDLIHEQVWNPKKEEYVDTYYLPHYQNDYKVTYPMIREGIDSLDVSLNNLKWTKDTSKKFFVALSKDKISGLPEKAQEMANVLKFNDVNFISAGTDKTKSDSLSLITKNNNKGTFVQGLDLDSIVQQITDYVVDQATIDLESNEIYITQDDEMTYSKFYSDIENDPQYINNGEKWKYTHDPDVFENNLGKADFSDKEISEPISKFPQVGMYTPYLSARDNPVDTDDRFDNYRMWGKFNTSGNIYVHRKPIANFTFNINKTTKSIQITNAAYDLDLYSQDNGNGKGIKKVEYRYRILGTDSWTYGTPSTLTSDVYEVEQKVEDYQYATNTIVKTINLTNTNEPPIADFEIPSVVAEGESVSPNDLSYDPNDDPLTYEWWVKEKNADDSLYKLFSTSDKPSRVMPLVGDYTFRLRVKDDKGLFSNYATKDIKVVPNNRPPIAGFNYVSPVWIKENIVLTSTATDPDGDPLTYEYSITKPDGTQYFIRTGDSGIDSNGNVTIQTTTKQDIGDWLITQTVSDGKDTDTTEVVTIEVLNQQVTGIVTHTPKWEENRQKYNYEKTGDINTPRTADVFWPGEKFVLIGQPTNTLATKIDVRIKEYPNYQTTLINDNGKWTGSIWDENMLSLFSQEASNKKKNGQDFILTFEFIASFQSGWVSDPYDAKIKIIDDPFWRQHTTY